VIAGEKVDIKPGNAMPLKGMPVGTIIHNIELKPGKGAQMCRAAGAYAQLVGRDQGYALVKLTSGELRKVRQECIASVGAVSNPDHMNTNMGKAGRKRWMGVRPTVVVTLSLIQVCQLRDIKQELINRLISLSFVEGNRNNG